MSKIFELPVLPLADEVVLPGMVAPIRLDPEAQAAVKYYENIRFVYEIESRVREFKRATVPAEPAPEEKNKNRKDNTSEQPEKRQDRNYSQEDNQPALAMIPSNAPVATGTTDRRFS